MQVLLHPSDMPVFRLAVRVAQCQLELRVNDVPVFRDATGLAQNFEMPVNEWLFQGHNNIRAIVAPLEGGTGFGAAASLEILLLHKCSGEAMRNSAEVGVLRWKPDPPHHYHAEGSGADDEAPLILDDDDDGAPLLALPGRVEELAWRVQAPQVQKDKSVRIHSFLNLPPPWPASPWARLRPLAQDNGTLIAVRQLVQTFWNGMRHGGFEPLLHHRRNALQTSYYLHDDRTDEALGFPRLLRMRGWQLQPLRDQGLELQLAAGSRLARVVDGRGESPLWLLNEESGVAAFIDCWWVFHGEWRMIR